MRIYIAGQFSERGRLRGIKTLLTEFNHEVSSSWLDVPDDDAYWGPDTIGSVGPKRDLKEIAGSELFILDTTTVDSNGGREFELGYAHAMGVPVIVVGPTRHIFQPLVAVQQVEDWMSLMPSLAGKHRVNSA